MPKRPYKGTVAPSKQYKRALLRHGANLAVGTLNHLDRYIKQSRTKTQTVSQSKSLRHGTRQTNAHGGTKSSYRYSHKFPKSWKIRAGLARPFIFHATDAYEWRSATGLQAANYDLDFNYSTLAEMRETIYATMPTEGAPENLTLFANTLKGLVLGIRKKHIITNMGNSNIYFTIYDISCKQDTDIAPDVAWNRASEEEGTLAQGQPISTSGLLGSSLFGTKPTDSELFKVNWKIRNRTVVVLGAGGTHVHYTTGRPNHVFNFQRLDVEGENGPGSAIKPYLKGMTHGILIVQHGGPAHDSGHTIITASKSCLDIISNKAYTFKSAHFNQKLQIVKGALATTGTFMVTLEDTDQVDVAVAE